MRSWRAPLLACAIVGAAGAPGLARAEFTIDIYGGPSWTDSADLRATGRDDTGFAVDARLFDIKTNTGGTAGLRLGYWLGPFPYVGIGMDLFFFSVPIPSQRVDATGTLNGEFLGEPITIDASGQGRIPSVTLPMVGFSPELRARLPLLTSKLLPKGLLQPYVTAGPAWAVSLDNEKVELIIGGKFGAGLAVSPISFLAVFAEYRYSFYPNFTLTNDNVKYETDVNTHQVVFGISLRF
jgi:opacity protein-like surface antigen